MGSRRWQPLLTGQLELRLESGRGAPRRLPRVPEELLAGAATARTEYAVFATCYGSPGVMSSRGGRMKSARFRKPVMTAFAQKKHSDFAPFVIEARQEVWYAVHGSIAEEGTSPSRAASSFGEAQVVRTPSPC